MLLKHLFALGCVLLCHVAWAAPALIPAPPQVSATSYVLMDANSGKIITEKGMHETVPPASLTKMLTAYIVEAAIAKGEVSLTDEVPISVKAWKTGGSKMFIKEGTEVLLEDLLRGVIIQSGNDASIALAEHVAGSEEAFVDIMNQQAQLLGMTHSSFMNATGLPDESHYSSAYDMALLAAAIINDYPQQYPMYAEKYFTYNDIRQPNRNKLLWRDKSVDGLKTGHTKAAGYCLVASAKREEMRLISVVLGAKGEEARARETQKLLNYGFRFFKTHTLYTEGQSLVDSKIWGGEVDQIQIGIPKEVLVTIPKGKRSALDAKVDIESVIRAPVQLGTELGRLVVKLDGETIVDEAVVALEGVSEGGLFKRIWHSIQLFFFGLFSSNA